MGPPLGLLGGSLSPPGGSSGISWESFVPPPLGPGLVSTHAFAFKAWAASNVKSMRPGGLGVLMGAWWVVGAASGVSLVGPRGIPRVIGGGGLVVLGRALGVLGGCLGWPRVTSGGLGGGFGGPRSGRARQAWHPQNISKTGVATHPPPRPTGRTADPKTPGPWGGPWGVLGGPWGALGGSLGVLRRAWGAPSDPEA